MSSLPSKPTWRPVACGDDILIKGVVATWFGGADDPDDDGQTASEINTKANPDFLGCALPFPTCEATKGSPLPIMPYLDTFVEVMGPARNIFVPVIDVGPALGTGHLPDLTKRAFVLVGGDLNKGLVPVTIRIIGGARYLKAVAA